MILKFIPDVSLHLFNWEASSSKYHSIHLGFGDLSSYCPEIFDISPSSNLKNCIINIFVKSKFKKKKIILSSYLDSYINI